MNVIDNKKFWSNVKFSLSDKTRKTKQIHTNRIVPDEIAPDDKKLSETFCEFFANAVPNLNKWIKTGNFDQTVTLFLLVQ